MRAIVIVASAALSSAALAQTPQILPVQGGQVRVETIAGGLEHPWGLAFLPDGRALVTERPGRLRLIGAGGRLSAPVQDTPSVLVRNQGGLLDVAVDPQFATNRRLVLCFAADSSTGASTHVARARLVEDGGTARLADVEVIFRQAPAIGRGHHFGCRIVFGRDGNMFVTLGDFFQQMREAQNLANTIGKVVRLRPDGSVPPDNPFVGRAGADPAIFSYGHRNVQAATLGPDGVLWVAEHGARGGDEVNRVLPGRNYGWPEVTRARGYDGSVISNVATRSDVEPAVHGWDETRTLAPSGAAFVSGDLFPAWRGNLLIGGLRARTLLRLAFDNNRVTAEEWMLEGLGERIRTIAQAPDGAIWLATDAAQGRVLRLTPAR